MGSDIIGNLNCTYFSYGKPRAYDDHLYLTKVFGNASTKDGVDDLARPDRKNTEQGIRKLGNVSKLLLQEGSCGHS